MDASKSVSSEKGIGVGNSVCPFSFTIQANPMAKKIIAAILAPFLLSSCISITKDASVFVPRQEFVTATLAPTSTQWVPTASLVPLETRMPSPVETPSTDCTNAAILLRDVTVPDHTQLQAGERFVKTWEFQNTGTCSWMGYTLNLISADPIDAPLTAPMAATAPNEKVQVSMELTAPTADGGAYAGTFSLYDPNGEVAPIGAEQTFWVKFNVGTFVSALPVNAEANLEQPENCIHSQNAEYVSQVVSLINAEREHSGLSILIVDPEIAAFAQRHAEEMAFNNFLSHDGSAGSFGERMMNYSIAHPGSSIFGEILAIGTPQDAMDQWRRDEHWDYVLGNGFARIGAGYAHSSCSNYGGYFTVDFGS
jgi:uncharacterized protein YkwD